MPLFLCPLFLVLSPNFTEEEGIFISSGSISLRAGTMYM